MFDSPMFALLLAAAILILGWYAIGSLYNVFRARQALQWIQKGLPQIGDKATLRWVGSSWVELKLAKAKDPFRSAEILIMLEPRDLPIIWWFERTRGRRDLLIVRAQLRAAPRFDLKARGQKIPAESELKREGTAHWTAVQGGVANNMSADIRGQISPYTVNRLIVAASLDGVKLTRLSVQRTVPNLELQFLLPNFNQVAATRLFGSLPQLCEEILKM